MTVAHLVRPYRLLTVTSMAYRNFKIGRPRRYNRLPTAAPDPYSFANRCHSWPGADFRRLRLTSNGLYDCLESNFSERPKLSMSFIQTFIKSVLPAKWSSAMEAKSRMWVLRCPCGHETSVWDMGGIRYKAAGNPWRRGRCGKCGQVVSGSLYRLTHL